MDYRFPNPAYAYEHHVSHDRSESMRKGVDALRKFGKVSVITVAMIVLAMLMIAGMVVVGVS